MTIDYEVAARENRGMLGALSREYFAPGLDRDDLLQEASIGLWKACRDYRAALGVPFKPFAVMCVRRQLITAIKAATRDKHRPLNHALNLDSPLPGSPDDSTPLHELIADPSSDVAEVAERRQRIRDLQTTMGTLSPMEHEAVLHVANGGSYAGDKRTDRALQRARRKLAA